MKNLKTKKLIVLIILLNLSNVKISAQIYEVVTGLSSTYGLALDQVNHLYTSQSGANANKII